MTTAIKITPAGEIDTIRIDELPDYQREIGGWVAELRLTNGHALLVDEEAGLKVTEPNLLASLYLYDMTRNGKLSAKPIHGWLKYMSKDTMIAEEYG